MRARAFLRRILVAMSAAAIVWSSSAAVVQATLPTVSSAAAARKAPAPGAIDGRSSDGIKVVPFVFTGDVRALHPVPSRPKEEFDLREPLSTKTTSSASPEAPNLALAPMPAPSQNFAGLSFADACTGGRCGAGWPPDTNGDVGSSDYIEAVNSSFAIYSKTGPWRASFTENSLWSGVGTTPCNGNNQGDPVVVYDQQADRWFLTDFAFAVSGVNPVSPFYECIAVSKTGDPVTGGWYLYALRMDPGGAGFPPVGTLNDYPKFGIWIDCLYMAANEFTMPVGTFAGTTYASLSRSDLESGASLTWGLGFINNTTDPFTMVPSNLSGTPPGQLPAPGTPNYFVSESQTAWGFDVRTFTVGTNCGGGGTLSSATSVSQASYTAPGQNIVPQPNTTNTLDSLGDRLMQKVQYRKVGSAESLWVVHSVLSSSTVKPQWAQIDVTGGAISTTPVQQQIYAPDTTLNRWMGSIAADRQGNVALGYSTSNGTSPNFPSIAYSGRLASDPLNTLPQTEVQLIAGGGSQTNSCGGAPCHRWGDYTAMSVDPADDCTFWYINEYYDTQVSGTSGNWHTRIGSFKFPTCVGGSPTVSSVTPANGPTGGGTTVTVSGTGFAGATAVHFGATAAAGLTVNSDTTITTTSPSGSGAVDVTVTGPGGTSATSSADHFTYLVGSTLSICDQSHLASAVAAGGTVTFSCNGAIGLSSTIPVSVTTVLDATGHTVVIDGGGNVGLVDVTGGVGFGVVNLTLQNGYTNLTGAAISSDGDVVATGTTFYNNRTSGGDGGAINAGSVGVTNSTFVSNQGGLGGAIVAATGITATNSTFLDNSGNGTIELDAGSAVLRNTILSGGGPNCYLGYLGSFTLTDGGGNFSTDASCGFTQASSHDSVAATTLHLGPLSDNGGPTQTIALGVGSVAIDAGVSCPPPAMDQRGIIRPQWNHCDSGAFEYGPVGSLRVTTSPALPAEISLNGVIADSWGLNWLEVPPGSYTVHFSHVEGYTEPADQVVVVTAGATTTLAGTFTQRGSLRVQTSPAVAGQISVDGVPRNDWGMWTDIPTGSHQVCFGPVAGYTPPACQNPTVTAGALTSVTGVY
jgi:IPT/TIG domain